MDFNLSPELITAIGTLILAIGTLILALETRRMREVQTEPEVYVNLQPHEEDIKFIDIIIGNAGQGTAFNVQFEIKPDFEYEDGKYLSELSYIKKGLPYLAPNQILKSFLINLWRKDFDKYNKPFEIIIKYTNIEGKKFNRIYPMDLDPLSDLSYANDPSIPQNINKIRKDINNISSTLKEISKK